MSPLHCMVQVTLLPTRWKFELTQDASPPGGGRVQSLGRHRENFVGGGLNGKPAITIWEVMSHWMPGGSVALAGVRAMNTKEIAALRRPDHVRIMHSPHSVMWLGSLTGVRVVCARRRQAVKSALIFSIARRWRSMAIGGAAMRIRLFSGVLALVTGRDTCTGSTVYNNQTGQMGKVDIEVEFSTGS